MHDTINIKELAKYCNVSPSTVSRVFSGNATVCAATRQKILDAARELNYAPQQTSRKDNIAIIVPSKQAIQPPSWFAGMLFTQLLRTVYHAGFVPGFYDCDDIQLIQPNFNLAAISLNWIPNETQFDYLNSLQRPVITINTVMPFAHSICTDHAGGIRQALHHLFRRNHRKIALLSTNSGTWGDNERRRAYQEEMKNAGIPFNPLLLGGGSPDGSLSVDQLRQMCAQGITAIVCPHEDWALQLNYALDLLGKKIPADISVISAEVTGLNQWFSPPQTAIRQNLDQIADHVLALLKQIGKAKSPALSNLQHIEVEYELIERNSVAII